MKFMACGWSDTGNVKEINQDSMLIKIAQCSVGQVALGMVCDGMGGLKCGELASAFVVKTFNDWFERCLPALLMDTNCMEIVRDNWTRMITDCNSRIMEYGKKKGFNIGTTITGILIVDDEYLTVNVGDSRVYLLNKEVMRLTKDQTVVEKEIEAGRLDPEAAKKDPRRSILLQCVGASVNVVPDYTKGRLTQNNTLVLCSDGFRHELTDEEIYEYLSANSFDDIKMAGNNIRQLIDKVKQRGERDNITAVVIKTCL